MIIFPSIELRRGTCASVRSGNDSIERVSGESPVKVAQHWAEQGAEWLHIVNLDGPLGATQHHLNALKRPESIRVQHPDQASAEGAHAELMRTLPTNMIRLMEIRKTVALPIQFAGGIATLADIELALELGADRVVLDESLLDSPTFVVEAIDRWGAERVIAGLVAPVADAGGDNHNGADRTTIVDRGQQIQAWGIRHVICDVLSGANGSDRSDLVENAPARDDAHSRCDVAAAANLAESAELRVTVGGWIAGLDEIERVKAMEHANIEGIIVGRPIYTGALDLATAIEVGHRPLEQYSAGIIPVRYGEAGVEFLLLYNWYFELWEFPRGPLEARETTVERARRAFSELTSLDLRTVYEGCNPQLNYMVVIRDYEIQHTVMYYLAEVETGSVQIGHEDHCEAFWGDYRSTWELLTETAPEQLPALDRAMQFLTEHREPPSAGDDADVS